MRIADLVELVYAIDSANWSTKVLLGFMALAFIVAGVVALLMLLMPEWGR